MTIQEEQTRAEAHQLIIAARDARIVQLQKQRNFWACGVGVLIVALVIVLTTS